MKVSKGEEVNNLFLFFTKEWDVPVCDDEIHLFNRQLLMAQHH